VVAPPALVERLVAWRTLVDRQGDQVVEHAVAELLDDGTLDRHLRRTRRRYAGRRDALTQALSEALPAVRPLPRPGGLALWCEVRGRSGAQVRRWAERCLQRGVFFETAGSYTLDGSHPAAVRLGFAPHTREELADAVGRMAEVW
jgi:GntR family transcriptional regulator/MocR family aminotransferase